VKIEMKVIGSKEVILKLRNMGDRVQENARKTMHRSADRIVKTAQKMAPVDQGNLEAAIQKQVGYESYRGRLKIDVVVVDSVNGVDVSRYAEQMHYGHYKLGEKSQLKQDGQSEIVGPGFLTRAAAPEDDKLNRQMVEMIAQETKNV
jgi:hypothetical protein